MKHIYAICLFAVALGASAQLRLASPIQNHMVLLQNSTVKLWGEADKGTIVEVTASWSDNSVRTKSDKSGNWSVDVTTPVGSYTPYTITISDSSSTITIEDVLDRCGQGHRGCGHNI